MDTETLERKVAELEEEVRGLKWDTNLIWYTAFFFWFMSLMLGKSVLWIMPAIFVGHFISEWVDDVQKRRRRRNTLSSQENHTANLGNRSNDHE